MEHDCITDGICDNCNRDVSDDDSHNGECSYCCPDHELTMIEWKNPSSLCDSYDGLTFGCENCRGIWYGTYNPE